MTLQIQKQHLHGETWALSGLHLTLFEEALKHKGAHLREMQATSEIGLGSSGYGSLGFMGFSCCMRCIVMLSYKTKCSAAMGQEVTYPLQVDELSAPTYG